MPELFGQDLTFSGRTLLWDYLLRDIRFNHILGSCYQAFWFPESHRIIDLNEIFYSPFTQAHNGYIDVFLQTGYVGVGLTLMILVSYFKDYIQIKKPHPWVLFIIVTIIVNFQESTILRIGHTFNFMFIFSYILLFVNNYKNFDWKAVSEIE